MEGQGSDERRGVGALPAALPLSTRSSLFLFHVVWSLPTAATVLGGREGTASMSDNRGFHHLNCTKN